MWVWYLADWYIKKLSYTWKKCFFVKIVATFHTFEIFPTKWALAQYFYTYVATKILITMQTNCKATWPAFIAHHTFKNCLNSVIFSVYEFPSKVLRYHYSVRDKVVSITDVLSCIKVQCFCKVYCVIAKPITYFL